MKKITEPLKKHLKANHCLYEFDRERRAVHFGMEGGNARWRCMGCGDDSGRFVLVSLVPLRAPETRRAACAELIARINSRLGLGHFDLDFKDGELRFLTTVPLGEADEISGEAIQDLIRGHQTLVDCFIPAISLVLFGAMTPERALAIDPCQPSTGAELRICLN